MTRRKIAVITGSRADYGLLYWIIRSIKEDPALRLQLLVTGTHLSARFGNTIARIEKDGFRAAARIPILSGGDSPREIAAAMSKAVKGFAAAYSRLSPDIVVVLGDRFEIFAAAGAAVPFGLPIAHIHGGETTEGAFDEQFRHAITKLSHLHFCATEKYRRRVIGMGEPPERAFCYGSPGLDNIRRTKYLDRKSLAERLGIPDGMMIGVVTYHPETASGSEKDLKAVTALLRSLAGTKGIFWVMTSPNADPGNVRISKMFVDFVHRHPGKARLFASLGSRLYLSLLKHAAVMAGNSSSGIIEAPSFSLPVVNVGNRQGGRIAARNVINIKEPSRTAISKAIRKAVSARFRSSLKGLKNPYGDGNSSKKIVSKLKLVDLAEITKKRFYGDVQR